MKLAPAKKVAVAVAIEAAAAVVVAVAAIAVAVVVAAAVEVFTAVAANPAVVVAACSRRMVAGVVVSAETVETTGRHAAPNTRPSHAWHRQLTESSNARDHVAGVFLKCSGSSVILAFSCGLGQE